MRTPKPFYRAFNDCWYVQIGKSQIPLAKGKDNEQEALKEYFQVMAGEGRVPDSGRKFSCSQAFDFFLEYAQNHTDSYSWYRDNLQSAADSFGRVLVRELKPFHVTRWTDAQKWSDTTKNKAIGCVQQAINYCKQQGIVEENPIRGMKKPTASARERILTPDERAEILAAVADQAFQDFLFAMQEAGCRPGEVARVTSEDVSLQHGLWILQKHKTRMTTGKPRVIYLTPALLALTKRLVEEHPEGPLFRNTKGKPWTKNAIRCRFRNLRKKLPHLKGVVAYTMRHSYATDALERGVPDASVAELMGHKGTATLHNYYSKLSQKRDHLRDMAKKAAGG